MEKFEVLADLVRQLGVAEDQLGQVSRELSALAKQRREHRPYDPAMYGTLLDERRRLLARRDRIAQIIDALEHQGQAPGTAGVA